MRQSARLKKKPLNAGTLAENEAIAPLGLLAELPRHCPGVHCCLSQRHSGLEARLAESGKSAIIAPKGSHASD